jgi:hypothetical protein
MGRRIFEAVAGIILLIVAFVAAYFFQQAYKSGVEYRALPVPLEDIPSYTVLSEEMFELKDFPSALIGGYAGALSQLVGRMSTSRIPAGLPIPLVLISAPEEYRLADPALEVLSIPVSASSTLVHPAWGIGTGFGTRDADRRKNPGRHGAGRHRAVLGFIHRRAGRLGQNINPGRHTRAARRDSEPDGRAQRRSHHVDHARAHKHLTRGKRSEGAHGKG